MYNDLTIEQVVDELKSVRDLKKDLDAKEKVLKERILLDGREMIQGKFAKMTISRRTSEVFNEEAFIETFKNDKNFEDAIKNTVIRTKEYIDQENLNNMVKDNLIPLDYVIPFNTVKESVVVNVK